MTGKRSLSVSNVAPVHTARVNSQVLKRPASAHSEGALLPRAVVLNLACRPDRWRDVCARLEKLGLVFERCEAVDGTACDISPSEVACTWSTAYNWKYVTKIFEGGVDCGYTVRTLTLTGGERGCAASHIAVWRRCVADAKPLMVLEDDAFPMAHFETRILRALRDLEDESPDLLYLGYSQAAPWRRSVSSVVREAEYLWTTVGYIVWPVGARKLLAEMPIDQPVDNYMAKLISLGKVRGFAVAPAVVRQAEAWNVNHNIPHSDDCAWV